MRINIKLISMYYDVVVSPAPNPESKKYDGEWWKVLAPVAVEVNGVTIKVPRGYITNLGSIPKILRSVVDKSDQSTLGFIVHDWMYRKQPANNSRMLADKALYKISKLSKQKFISRWLIFIGVRIGGWLSYRKHLPIINDVSERVLFNIANNSSVTRFEYKDSMDTQP